MNLLPNKKIPQNMHLETSNYGMSYYKVLKNFILICSFMFNLANAIMYITGSIYENTQDTTLAIYSEFTSLYTVDYIYGFAMLAFSIFSLYVRNQLVNYTKRAPMFVVIFFSAYIAIPILHNMIQFFILNLYSEAINQAVVPIIVVALIVHANVRYFNNRNNLFIN